MIRLRCKSPKNSIVAGRDLIVYSDSKSRTMKTLTTILFALFSSALLAQPSSGRLAWWTFDGHLNDVHGHNGTGFEIAYGTDRSGQANKALLTDGNDYVSVSNENDFNFGASDFTISVWIKRSSNTGSEAICAKQQTGIYKGWNLWFSNGRVMLIAGQNPNVNMVQTGALLGDNQWHHIVAIKIGNTAANWKIFVDGTLDVQVNTALMSITDLTNAGPFWIGRRHAGNTFNGQIDDLMIYNRALSDQEAVLEEQDPIAACANVFCTPEGVGIKTSYVPSGYVMAVKGKLAAEEVRVELHTAWPDYVLKPGYELPDLKFTRDYISKNGHLPDVPSASEVQKNGIELGTMNAVLLRKIEELTLHILALEEKIDKLTPKKPDE